MSNPETLQKAIDFFKSVNNAVDDGLCQDCVNKIKESLKFKSAGGSGLPHSRFQDRTAIKAGVNYHDQEEFRSRET